MSGNTAKKMIKVDEMFDLTSFMKKTANSVREAEALAQEFLEIEFYEEGSAREMLALYPAALAKIPDLAAHYERMVSLIEFTSEEFQAKDQAIKSSIEQTQGQLR